MELYIDPSVDREKISKFNRKFEFDLIYYPELFSVVLPQQAPLNSFSREKFFLNFLAELFAMYFYLEIETHEQLGQITEHEFNYLTTNMSFILKPNKTNDIDKKIYDPIFAMMGKKIYTIINGNFESSFQYIVEFKFNLSQISGHFNYDLIADILNGICDSRKFINWIIKSFNDGIYCKLLLKHMLKIKEFYDFDQQLNFKQLLFTTKTIDLIINTQYEITQDELEKFADFNKSHLHLDSDIIDHIITNHDKIKTNGFSIQEVLSLGVKYYHSKKPEINAYLIDISKRQKAKK